MRNTLFLISLLALLLSFFSCEKEKTEARPERISQQEMFDCFDAAQWDSTRIAETLIGEWRWQYSICFWTGQRVDSTSLAGISVEFLPNGEYAVRDNGTLSSSGEWTLSRNGNPAYYSLELDPFNGLLGGNVLFCEEWLESYASFVDGCDNFFTRVP